ncbi:RNB-domain-containing protein [Aureobasidium pullulans]|uniref:RNB-domain-containing protein n=1 Tax=Aureobasidium pullulans TaxID=5580 RepID=A0A4T0BPC2_AURPU|nr:RNB-domain-containing protein [Aureobasidium pullulans]
MTGSSGTFGEFSFPGGAKSENVNPRPRNSGSVSGGSGHSRRHSLALPEAKKAAEIAEQKRKQSGFQFPIPGAAGATPDRSVSPGNANNDMPPPANNFSARNSGRGGHGRSQSLAVGNQRNQRGGPAFQFPPPGEINNVPERRGSQGHGRTQSRNFDGNWRQQQPTIQEQHATNMGNFQMNQHAGAQPFQPGHRQRGSVSSQSISSISNFQFPQQPQLVQLPQGQVLMQPNMFATQNLNALQLAQIQAYQAAGLQPPIAGLQGQQGGQQMTMQQQQQQRKTLFTPYLPQATLPALLGDGQLVAGILRVNKKNRSDAYVTTNDLDADIFICGSKDRNRALEGDLVAVELLDVDEVWGQKREKEEKKKRKDMTDSRGTSMTAEAERQGRDGGNQRNQPDRQQDRPKIVWFKPTDKRVPLIAIPTEQAPKDFVEKHQDYANKIFVACIKRWPITSLHPFGTLVEQLGDAGDLKVETDALLRDNNFGPDDFSDAVLKNVGYEDWSVAKDGEAALESRRDFRNEQTFTIDPNGSEELDDAIHFKTLSDGHVEIGVHVADISHFVKPSSMVDREAKKRGSGVYLMNRTVKMLPPKISSEICSLSPGEERYTVSVVFKINPDTGRVLDEDTWIGKAIIKSTGKVSYDQVDSIVNGQGNSGLEGERASQIQQLHSISQKLRQARFGDGTTNNQPLRLIYQLDDENVPVEHNIFDSSPAHELIEELSHKTNSFVAQKIFAGLPEKALLRKQAPPNPRRLVTLSERMANIGVDVDTSSSGALQNSLFQIEDPDVRKGVETLLIKAMRRAKYFIPSKSPADQYPHYALNLPLYTHFTNPSRRYADIVVHRQLEHVLTNGAVEFTEDVEALAKTAETANTKKDSAHAAQEQSVHIESCRALDRKSQELGGDLISEGIVLCVYESAFDVLIPEYGFEKRVHCDQLPLKKAEFDKNKRLLELYWEKGVPSSAFVPEDEKPKASRANNWIAAAAARDSAATRAKEEEAQRKQMQTATISTDDADALFDDDDDAVSEITEQAAGVSLNTDRNTQSMPPSPTRNGISSQHGPQRTKSDSKILHTTPEAKLSNKDKYLKLFSLRESDGNYIQDVREMSRVPVILKTDMTKSPPCLTIRSLNPYAL